jgi:outer membrane lipoprotein SlyB
LNLKLPISIDTDRAFVLNVVAMKRLECAMKRIMCFITLLGFMVAAGCAGKSKPIIDPASVDMEQYEIDLAECEQIAEQVDQQAGTSAAGGAIIGGLIGAITGDSTRAARGAGVGAVVGGAKGAGSTNKEISRVVKNCLRNRGYEILN